MTREELLYRQNEASKRYYQRNIEARREYARAYITDQDVKARRRARAARYTNRNREYLVLAKDKPCADCGVKFAPCAMDFDHTRSEKKFTIGSGGTMSLKKLKEEIAKCDVVCANCHRVRTVVRNLLS